MQDSQEAGSCSFELLNVMHAACALLGPALRFHSRVHACVTTKIG